MLRVCSEYACQEVSASEESRWCEAHTRPEKTNRKTPQSARERGYDRAWNKLSERARKAQPFCSDCGQTSGLTADHLPSAWARREEGLPLRLVDVDVVCGPCNTARGSSRVGSQRAQSPAEMAAQALRAQRRRPEDRRP